MPEHPVPRKILENNVQELTEQLYGCYQRIAQLNEQLHEANRENKALKDEIEALADERTGKS